MNPIAAVWKLAAHPLRHRLRHDAFYDDHGARHATRRHRRLWWLLNLFPAALWAALGVWRLVTGDVALGLAHIIGGLTLGLTVAMIRNQYVAGYVRGAIQNGIDVRARSFGRPHDVTRRAMPHPADPAPDLRRLYGDIDGRDDDVGADDDA